MAEKVRVQGLQQGQNLDPAEKATIPRRHCVRRFGGQCSRKLHQGCEAASDYQTRASIPISKLVDRAR